MTNPPVLDQSASTSSSPKPGRRLLSLDVMRGLTVAAMILVNNNGDYLHAYWPLLHSRWNGCTPTDLIFPAFLFMVGVSISFSMLPKVQAGQRAASFLPGVLRRTVLLILLGLVVNGYPYFHLGTLRFCGVLQRIALCFLFTSLMTLWGNTWSRIAAACVLLASYWALIRFAPVPGYGYPVHDFMLLDPWRNLASYIDRAVFPGHLYGNGTYDPEGLLSTLPAIANCLLGVLAGEWLRVLRRAETQPEIKPQTKVAMLFVAGCVGVALAFAWSHFLPFNKRLWTSSFALLAAGVACTLLAALYYILDVRRWDRFWTIPWLVFGTNAISAYIFSELLAPTLQLIRLPDGENLSQASMRHIFSRVGSPPIASLAYSLCFVAVCYVPILWMYRKRIYIRV